MGIYGYTAYSASKFALRGMAEALQQEVIAENIHLSLLFPPDTETPGLAEGMEILFLFCFSAGLHNFFFLSKLILCCTLALYFC